MSGSHDRSPSIGQEIKRRRHSKVTGGRPVIYPYSGDGLLRHDAASRVLGTMLFPEHGNTERQRRRRFIQRMMAATEDALDEYRKRIAAGRNAGAILLHQIRGYLVRQPDTTIAQPKITDSVEWVRAALLDDAGLPKTGLSHSGLPLDWHNVRDRLNKRGHRIKRPRVFRDWSDFRLVSHLWAALILADDPDVDQWSRVEFVKYPARIPAFTAFAEALAEHAAIIPVLRRQELLLPPGRRWRIAIPAAKRAAPITVSLSGKSQTSV